MKTFKGKIEVKIGDVLYVGTVNLKPSDEAPSRQKYAVYGVRIDRKNSDPEAAVEYIGNAAGFTPARGNDAGSWKDNPIFNKIKPCLVINGEPSCYLNPDNFSETIDGRLLGAIRNHCDTMIEFDKIYYRITQDENYNYVEVADSEESLKDGFTDWAFSYKGKVRDKFYIGAYKGYIRHGRLRSIPDVMPTTDKTIGEFREAAQANGVGYEITAFNKLLLLQVLYLIRFKSLNSQVALGKGLTGTCSIGETGLTDTKGLYYGEQDDSTHVKCHGLEDFWGNIFEWVDGLVTVGDEIKIADGNFNDKGDNYETAAKIDKNVYGVITEIHGNNKLGFLPKTADDYIEAGRTHYCNYGSVYPGSLPVLGGAAWSGSGAGAFRLSVSRWAVDAFPGLGARLLLCTE